MGVQTRRCLLKLGHLDVKRGGVVGGRLCRVERQFLWRRVSGTVLECGVLHCECASFGQSVELLRRGAS